MSDTMMRRTIIVLLIACVGASDARGRQTGPQARFARARQNGRDFDRGAAAMRKVLKAWLAEADRGTFLIPDRLSGGPGWRPGERIYTPHNSGADLYSYLILTASLTDPAIYNRRMIEMLRNEIRYTTTTDAVPGSLDLITRRRGEPRVFDAAEYAKDGLVAVTELLGRTPWYYRMVDMTVDMMHRAPVITRFGNIPGDDAETNGDALQVLVRLAGMTGDKRFLEWAERIGDAYVDEVLPGNNGLPDHKWDFEKHTGTGRLRLRDHGNEIIVGLALLFAIEQYHQTERARRYRPVLANMFDRILESANADGMFHNIIDTRTLKPRRVALVDNWGYIYGAAYAFYQSTGETKYRDAVIGALKTLPKYRDHNWQRGQADGLADSIESAFYLVAREPVPEALEWIESQVRRMTAMQKPSGFVDRWYNDGNFNRTLLLYILYKSQGCRPDRWVKGLRVGAVREGDRLYLNVAAVGRATRLRGKIKFDFARHRRVMGFDKNYVRLNEFPEWYTVDENTLYRVSAASKRSERILLGSELIAGIALRPGDWVIEPVGRSQLGR
ncbi:MAG TPA: hypothetical protein VJH03_02700 [Blastocatellia bacterium]|nr:hypothetical protein [Blastocatellia bacterium]